MPFGSEVINLTLAFGTCNRYRRMLYNHKPNLLNFIMADLEKHAQYRNAVRHPESYKQTVARHIQI